MRLRSVPYGMVEAHFDPRDRGYYGPLILAWRGMVWFGLVFGINQNVIFEKIQYSVISVWFLVLVLVPSEIKATTTC